MALYYSEATARASPACPSLFLSLSFEFSALPFSTVARFAWPRGNLNGNVNSRDEHVQRRGLWSIRFVAFLSSFFFSFFFSLLSVCLSFSLLWPFRVFLLLPPPASPSSSLFVRASAVLIEIFRPVERGRERILRSPRFPPFFPLFFCFFFLRPFFSLSLSLGGIPFSSGRRKTPSDPTFDFNLAFTIFD